MQPDMLRQALRAAAVLLRYRISRGRFRRSESRPLQLQYQGQQVRIERSEHGVPWITAASEAAAYFGQGHAMATDRLWQLDLLRRNADGRLSEILGSATVPFDVYHRTLQLRRMARQSLPLLAGETADLLLAFAAGINAVIAACNAGARQLPLEFELLQYAPTPWHPEDTLLIGKLVSLQFSMNLKYKALTHELLKVFSLEQVEAVSARCAVDEFVTLTNDGARRRAPAAQFGTPDHNVDLGPLLGLLGGVSAAGSNALAISGRHTASGYPLLANDPHVSFSLPAQLHQSRLQCSDPHNEFHACGVNVPGLPGFISGHNQHIAWGITNSQVDVQDLILRGAAGEPQCSMFDSADYAEEIHVRGARSKHVTVQFTPLGPRLDSVLGNDRAASELIFCWSGLAPGRDAQGLLQLPKARCWKEFRSGLENFESLSLNFLFAARDGDIGFKTVGRVPLRRQGLAHTPIANDWLGFVGFDALPELHNPPSGIIVNSNNPITDNDYAPALTTLWNPCYRARRIFQLIAGRQGLTAAHLESLQQDVLNLHAQELLPLLLDLVDPEHSNVCPVTRQLRGWDYRDDSSSPAAALWQRLFSTLIERLYGERFQRFLPYFENKVIATTHIVRSALANTPTPWLQDRAALADLVMDALRAIAVPSGKYPSWGTQHWLGFEHPLSAALGPLRQLTDIAPRPMDGSNVTVAFNWAYPQISGGPVWRMVVAFDAAISLSRSLLLPGQSGDFRSRWYADQFGQAHAQPHALLTVTSIAAPPG